MRQATEKYWVFLVYHGDKRRENVHIVVHVATYGTSNRDNMRLAVPSECNCSRMPMQKAVPSKVMCVAGKLLLSQTDGEKTMETNSSGNDSPVSASGQAAVTNKRSERDYRCEKFLR